MQNEEEIRKVFHATQILRKPITGIVSGYHELPYIFISPDEADQSHTVEISGKINVSPKFILSPSMLAETFGDVFDPETMEQGLSGRFFSFAYAKTKNLKVESEYLRITNYEVRPQERLDTVHDQLQQQENVKTALVFGPRFAYYPVSLDKLINEILDREFKA